MRLSLRLSFAVASCASARRGLSSSPASPRLAALRKRLAAEPAPRRLSAPAPPPPSAAEEEASPSAPLLDAHGRRHTYLRVSLTERCNLRCTYCMPAEGLPALTPDARLLSTPEVLRVAALLAARGVDKVRLTGGEPTLRPDLAGVVRGLAALRPAGLHTIAMTTNGVTLERALPELVEAGLSHVNISLDSLRPARFAALSRRPEAAWHRVWAAVRAALGAGLRGLVKLNCVVVRGVNDDEVADFAALTRELPLEVRFIELMPFAGNGFAASQAVGWRESAAAIALRHPGFAPLENWGAEGGGGGGGGGDGTARLWRVPGAPGRVGFIATMTDAFCGTCSRLRLTADGNVKACLHGDEEHGLRDAMRGGASDAQLAAIVRAALRGKHLALGGKRDGAGLAAAAEAPTTLPPAVGRRRSMIQIGG
jgi:molybdenum cofactor biosynthesis protein A